MRKLLLAAASAVLLFSCSQGDSSQKYDRAGVDLRYTAVYDLTKDLSCTDSSQCSSIGIGSKPCGGPWRYQVYSTGTVDADKLNAAVADLDAYEAGYNAQEGIASDCSMEPAPNPSCVNNQCVDLNASQ